MTKDMQPIIERGPYLADDETIRSVASRLTTLDDVRFVLVARKPNHVDRRWTLRIQAAAIYFAVFVAVIIGLRLIFGYSWIVNALVFVFFAIAHGFRIDRIARMIKRPRDGNPRTNERIYALTGTHLHRIAVKNGVERRQVFALGKAEQSARFMSGPVVNYRLRFAEGGIDLLDLPYSPEADAILMQPIQTGNATASRSLPRLAEAA